MDQYLHWDNNHFISAKTVFLIHWHSGQKCSAPINIWDKQKLNKLGKPYWLLFSPMGLNNLITKFNHKHSIYNTQTVNSDQHDNSYNSGSNNKNISIVVPYIKVLSFRFKKTCNSLGIQVHLKGNNTIQTLLMAPRIKTINVRRVR